MLSSSERPIGNVPADLWFVQKRIKENLACAIERVALLAGFLNEAPAEFIGADVKLHNNRILPFLIYNTKGKLNIFEEYLWCFGKMPKV